MTYKEASDMFATLNKHLGNRSGEMLKLVRKACDKQVPTVPEIYGDGYAEVALVLDSWKCPNCDKVYELDYDAYKYCPNCGQCIDWTVYEEGE